MKKFLLIGLFLLLGHQAYAAQATATMGDQNSSGIYRITCDINGVCTYAQDTGVLHPYLATATTNTTLTAYQTGTTLVFGNGAGAAADGTTYTLPAAAVGMQFSFVSDVAKYFRIAPNGTDVFKYSTATTSSKLKNSSAAAGDSITIFCATAGNWSIKAKSGTWVVDNT